VTITTMPLNGAPAPQDLARAHVTPTPHFFVRNHAAVPAALRSPLSALLQGLSRTSIEATIQCAGNRRSGLQRVRHIRNEIPWENEAIGNAHWEGVALGAFLDRVGVPAEAQHVWFVGADRVNGKGGFGASIPLDKALRGGVLLADTMNGAALTPEHGAPLRVIVPGYIGARSVKWLREIRVEREPSPNYFQRAYSLFSPSTLAVPDDHANGTILGELPVNSAISDPIAGGECAPGLVRMRGWAMAGGDRTIERVECSHDGGAHWTPAHFVSPAKRFTWRLWTLELRLVRGAHTLVCRAVDSAGNQQPADPEHVWNVKGYANNSWHRISVTVA
jgi:sulfite oxidase